MSVGEKVLVVSCNCEVSVHLLNNLRKCKLEYFVVTSGSACFNIAKNNKVNVVVIDNSILDIQGYQLVDSLKKIKPDIRVVFINDIQDNEIESKVRQAGIKYYTSDLRDPEIVRIVSRLMAKKKFNSLTS